MMKANMHIHSKYSWDCRMELEDIAKVLIDNGIYYAGICDHIEFNVEPFLSVLAKFELRNQEIDELNEKYNGQIKLLKGAEISSPHLYPDRVNGLKALNLDYLMGSIHKLDRKAKTKEEKKIGSYNYYKEILKMVKANQVDVIGHIDYINRYYHEDYSDPSMLEEIFGIIKDNNKIIEVNTSAYRRTELYTSFPSTDKLEMYAKTNNAITLGTDAHQKDELTYMLNENAKITNSIGLEQVIFEKRKMLKI